MRSRNAAIKKSLSQNTADLGDWNERDMTGIANGMLMTGHTAGIGQGHYGYYPNHQRGMPE